MCTTGSCAPPVSVHHLITSFPQVQYLLTLVDDFLQEDKSRVAIFRDYSRKRKESVWAAFLNLLNRPDGFIQNMTSRVVAKMACWSVEQMAGSDLQVA